MQDVRKRNQPFAGIDRHLSFHIDKSGKNRKIESSGIHNDPGRSNDAFPLVITSMRKEGIKV